MIRANVAAQKLSMEYQTQSHDIRSDGENVNVRFRDGRSQRGRSGVNGVKEQAVGQAAQKAQQGTGNSAMTFVSDTMTNTVTNNFNF